MESRPEQPQPEFQAITVSTWVEANQLLDKVLNGQRATLGSGYDYPAPFAYFTKDAWSGDGMGYRVYKTRDKKLDRLVADISVRAEHQEPKSPPTR